MKRSNHITAFYLETILLIIVFMGIIMVLTNIFGGSKVISSSAKHLNNAVYLAENAAEAVAASKKPEDVMTLLDAAEAADDSADNSGDRLRVNYDEYMKPDADGPYHVDVTWEPQSGSSGTLVSSNISVYFGRSDAPLYRLKTAVYVEEDNR